MSKPKCIVKKAQEQGKSLTDAELQALPIPLAKECVTCQLRAEDKLQKMCWKDI